MRKAVLGLGLPTLAAALIGALVIAGAVAWFGPYLTQKREFAAEVPAPPPLFVLSEFSVPPRQQACMSSVAVDSNSNLVSFQLPKRTPEGAPPMDFVMSAAGYRAVVHVPGGHPGGGVVLPITPPRRALIGTACFINRGRTTLLLDGTTEARSESRSQTQISDSPVAGDIQLSFLSDTRRSLLDRVNEVFEHASTLTDRLIPRWLVWVLAVLVAIGVPALMIGAFYLALREDEAAAR